MLRDTPRKQERQTLTDGPILTRSLSDWCVRALSATLHGELVSMVIEEESIMQCSYKGWDLILSLNPLPPLLLWLSPVLSTYMFNSQLNTASFTSFYGGARLESNARKCAWGKVRHSGPHKIGICYQYLFLTLTINLIFTTLYLPCRDNQKL